MEKAGIYVAKIDYVEYYRFNLCLIVNYVIIPDGLGDDEIGFDTFASSRFFCDSEETFDCFYDKEISLIDFDVVQDSFDPACETLFRIVKTTVGKDVLDNV